MSFTPVKPAGWAFGEILTSAQMNQLDADHAYAVDGRGGAYSLAQPLQFEDDNVIIAVSAGFVSYGLVTLHSSADFSCAATALFTGSLTSTGDFRWNGSGNFTIADAGAAAFVVETYTQFEKLVNFLETVTFPVGSTGYSFSAAGKTEFNALATFTAGVSIGGSLTVNTNANVDGTFAVGLTTNLIGRATIKRLVRDPVIVTAALGVFSIATGNEYIAELAVDSAWSFSDLGAENGESVEFTNYSTAHIVNLEMPAGTKIDGAVETAYNLHGMSGGITNIRFTRIAGVWHRQRETRVT